MLSVRARARQAFFQGAAEVRAAVFSLEGARSFPNQSTLQGYTTFTITARQVNEVSESKSFRLSRQDLDGQLRATSVTGETPRRSNAYKRPIGVDRAE